MRNDGRSDRELVGQARKGDASAFRVLVERHQRKAYAVALGIVRNHDDALDICQDAFLRAHRGLAEFEGDSQFYTWLYRIVHNLAIDQLRRRRFEAVSLDAVGSVLADDSQQGDPERNVSRSKLAASFDEGLAALSPAHRAVLILREVQGLSYQEIADAMSCSIGTVMSRLFHARKKMQALLLDDRRAYAMAA